MANKQQLQESSSSSTPETQNTLQGGLVKDTMDTFQKSGTYTHARNGTTVLPNGQEGGALHTEPANILNTILPYPFIGFIPLIGDQFVLFLTDNTTSEIGIFYDSTGVYTTIMNDAATISSGRPGLNFKTSNLIIGASRQTFDCSFGVYWSDGGLNPDRMIDTAFLYPDPWVQQDLTPTGDCRTFVNTNIIDTDKLRLAPLINIPCLTFAKGASSGQLPNGSYQVAIRYAVNSISCTGFLALSPIISLWTHNNNGSSAKLTLTGTETNIFQELEVVLISQVNMQVEARSLGIYSTFEHTIYIDNIDRTLPIVPLNQIPLNNPAIEKSNAIYSLGDYLVRVGTSTKPEPNYQPLANNITTWWTCVEYSDTYYRDGGDKSGMNVGSMRDEVYAYYLRWVWNTGDKTVSYHISGLPVGTQPTFVYGGPSTGDSGTTIAHGRMGGYSSTEIYPDTQPRVWGPLCGKPVMHHKFPDQTTHPELTHFTSNNTIRVMGVYFDNIALPVDNNRNVLTDIIGYEILRAVRDGNESIIAKGQVNHMRQYTNPDGSVGLYQNYPYDDLHPDRYLTSDQTIGTVGGAFDGYQGNELKGVSNSVVSFHSPDTSFQHPNLGGNGSLVLYQAHSGTAVGSFDTPYKHPMFKLLTDQASFLSNIIGLTAGLSTVLSSITGSNIALSGTDDLPINIPLGFASIPELDVLGTSVLGAAIYGASVILSTALAVAMVPLTNKIVSQQILNVINGLVPAAQYARQYDSHGFYNNPVFTSKYSYSVSDYQYVQGQIQTFASQDINNLYRNNYLALSGVNLPSFPGYTNDPVTNNYKGAVIFSNSTGTGNGTIVSGSVDCSRFTLGQGPSSPYSPGPKPSLGPFLSPIISWYGGYKVNLAAQYGQVDSPKQVPISCLQSVDTSIASTGLTYTSPILFGGDTYINRYTEKNPFFFFNDWLFGQENDYQYDYTVYENVPYPRYWINNTKIYYDFWQQSSRNWHLDELPSIGLLDFWVKGGGYFYLFNNGVRDFYVESTVNVGYRDWEDDLSKRFYDPYGFTNTSYLFRSDIIKSDILYKYDYSLSANKFWNQYLSWGHMFDRDYNPDLAYTCFAYYPRRLNYSLPQTEEDKKDNWKIFLPANYKDMPAEVTAIENVGNTGALILMNDRSPVQFIGTTTIPSSDGTDYTVGNGNLFNQALSSGSNADQAYQFGSCQNRLSVINIQHGLFWLSQNTGKFFTINGNNVIDIAQEAGMKYWLMQYLPSQLLKQFPTYTEYDNPLDGVGVQLIYDANNEIIYLCKKDKYLLPQYVGTVLYDPLYGFYTTDGIYTCPPGYTLVGMTCVKTAPAIPTSGAFTAIHVTNNLYSEAGAAIFNLGYTLGGIGTYTLVNTAFWIARGKLIGVWPTSSGAPLNTLLGFSQCITVPNTQTYYIGMCADDSVVINVDGVPVVSILTAVDRIGYTSQFGSSIPAYGLGQSAPFLLFNIFPVMITAGSHVLEVLGSNGGGPGMMGMEIYKNTAAELIAATSTSSLNVVFTTQGKTSFPSVGYSCPTGYNLLPGTTVCDLPECKVVIPATLDRFPVPNSYFQDISWTLSYDCKRKSFISFHDWHPALSTPSRSHFLTTSKEYDGGKSLWRHNSVTNNFCTYYGIAYPFEVEYVITTGVQTTTLQSVQYFADAYSYMPDQTDRFQQYWATFNLAVISNDEQSTGYLNLVQQPYDNPYATLNYPDYSSASSLGVLQNKVENKFRFNMGLKDFTNDRGMFTLTTTPFWNTNPNGYVRTPVPGYISYSKLWNQLKAIRGRNARIFLSRTNNQNTSLSIYIAMSQNIISKR